MTVPAPIGAVNARTPTPPIPADVYDVEQLEEAEIVAVLHQMAMEPHRYDLAVIRAVRDRVDCMNMAAMWRRSRHRPTADENVTPAATPAAEPPLPIGSKFDGLPRPAGPAPTPTPVPPLRDVTVPADNSSDPDDVTRARRSMRHHLSSLARHAHVKAHVGSRDPVAEAVGPLGADSYPLARYLFVRMVAGRDDLAAAYLPAAVADYQARRAVIDRALPGLLPAELVQAAAAPATPAAPPPSPSARPSRAAAHHPPPPAPAHADDTPPAAELRYHKWCAIPQNELDAWAISPKGAAMLFEQFEADHARVKAEVPATEFAARWWHLCETGAVISFGSEKVFGIVSARAQDLRESIRGKYRYQPPEHLKEQIDARRQELYRLSQDRRAGRTQQPTDRPKTKKVKKADTKKGRANEPRLVAKTRQLREFREHAAEWGITGHTQLVWRELWDSEGWVAGRQWTGHTAVRLADLIKRLGISKSTIQRSVEQLEDAKLIDEAKKERKGVSAKVYMITFKPGCWDWIPDRDETSDGVSEVE